MHVMMGRLVVSFLFFISFLFMNFSFDDLTIDQLSGVKMRTVQQRAGWVHLSRADPAR